MLLKLDETNTIKKPFYLDGREILVSWQSKLSITTEELSTEPQSSLRRIIRFIGNARLCRTTEVTMSAVESRGVERTKKRCSTHLER